MAVSIKYSIAFRLLTIDPSPFCSQARQSHSFLHHTTFALRLISLSPACDFPTQGTSFRKGGASCSGRTSSSIGAGSSILLSAACVVQRIRSSGPARLVQSGRGNVSGRYPSRKMGVTIQFESHKNELAGIQELEHATDVIEFFDQPHSIKLEYQSAAGKKLGGCIRQIFCHS